MRRREFITLLGELEITRRMSLIAVCCSSASDSSRVRASSVCSSSHAYALSFFSDAA